MTTSVRTRPDPIVGALVHARLDKGLRQQDVAAAAGISRRALVSIEQGGDCTLSTLRSLCEALGVDLHAASRPAPSLQQADRELAEAMRVQSMAPAELSRWLAGTWGRLQRQAASITAGNPAPAVPRARHFETMAQKNEFDRDLETKQALALALKRT